MATDVRIQEPVLPHTEPFALGILVVAIAALAVLGVSHVSERTRVPVPALVLVATAVAAKLLPGLHAPSQTLASEVVTLVLIGVLFDGGMHLGWRRFRSQAGATVTLGVAGTFGTAALGAVFAHLALGFTWYISLLLGTAVAPTDPTVVFSVLGKRQVRGPSGAILEGESGANDPVGIALMTALLTAHGLSAHGAAQAAVTFVLQVVVGGAFGVLGGRALLWMMRNIPLPAEGLYPIRTLTASLLLFGAASVAHGSGFLSVFVAGILIGDERAPYKREIERFHGALASLGEMVAFVALGLTVDLHSLARSSAWIPGLVLGLVLAAVIRPAVAEPCLRPWGLSRAERLFVEFAGLKGAVPILLGGYLLMAHVAKAERLYSIVIVVVVVSVILQGGLVGPVARRLRLPVRLVEPEPWSLGVRLRSDPENVHRVLVSSGSPADGSSVSALQSLPPDAWITLLVREGHLVPVRGDTVLRAGDRLTVLSDASRLPELRETFGVSD